MEFYCVCLCTSYCRCWATLCDICFLSKAIKVDTKVVICKLKFLICLKQVKQPIKVTQNNPKIVKYMFEKRQTTAALKQWCFHNDEDFSECFYLLWCNLLSLKVNCGHFTADCSSSSNSNMATSLQNVFFSRVECFFSLSTWLWFQENVRRIYFSAEKQALECLVRSLERRLAKSQTQLAQLALFLKETEKEKIKLAI